MLWAHLSDWLSAAVSSNGWLAFLGFLGQGAFAVRFIIQWYASEKAGRSIVPPVFWYVSLAAALMTMIYGLLRPELIIILGQLPALGVYIRNIVLIRRERRQRRERRRQHQASLAEREEA